MRRSGIFIKIYLWFWLATALVVTTQVGLDTFSVSDPPFVHRLQQTIDRALSVYSRKSAELNVDGNNIELARLVETLKESTGVTIYRIDKKGEEAGMPSFPRDVAEMARRVELSGKEEFSFFNEKALLGRTLTTQDGMHYLVVGSLHHEPFGPPPGPPGPPDKNGPHGPPPPGPKPFFMDIFGPPPPGQGPLFMIARLLIVLTMSGVVCYWLARYVTTPVVTLQKATRRLAGGDLAVRIGKGIGSRKDELSELAKDFDHMAERISLLMVQQRQLLRDISHELRSPLTRLNVAVELARRQTGEKTAPSLDRIEAESNILNEMIGEVLTIARLDSETERIPMLPVDLKDVVTEIIENANFEAQARNCAVELVESIPSSVQGNKDLLCRAIENVIRNAVIYTYEGTTVDVRLRQASHEGISYAEVTVRDHGPGVPETDLPHLFRPFFRVSNARERQTGGTGLGLAITKRAIDLHNGSVKASNARDGGLIVEIRLRIHAS